MMAVKEKSTKKKDTGKAPSRDSIMTAYMQLVLESEKLPGSLYKFCKDLKMSEAEFYQHFGSFESLQKSIWVAFFDETMKIISNSEEYEMFSKREKLLTFYFTMFEILTLNRSYILFTLKSPLDLAQLAQLRLSFKTYMTSLSELSTNDQEQVKHYSAKAVEELGWAQFLVILRFWIKDDSASFEKTDVMIEKTINTTFDLVDTTPIKSVIDYAKFLFKETVGK
ncbi:MAG: TetR family transcriptional regulator C-terminal domain-containing protein [Reichenbachiella sp.]|uniref:TetR family transcriptional regulator C-terminal domain-containing protein n=1 Tax=Reichenbachiella sp. TaxID=2184521 RepID=UPI003267BB63